MKKCVAFVFVGMIFGVAGAASLTLYPAEFPKTSDDIKWSDRMKILADDYENYAGLSPYQQLILDDVEAQVHAEIDSINASECIQTGEACDMETPVSDGSTYEVAENNTNNGEQSAHNVQDHAPQGIASQGSNNNNDDATIRSILSHIANNGGTQAGQNNSPQVATGYCSARQPEIPQGQTIPLGSPVRFDDLAASASDRSKRIATNSKNGMFCSPYGCREKYNNRGSYRPHQGIDIGCTADYFGLPIYTPADGVVTQVTYAQRGKSAGNYIRIKHSDGWETQYMHLEKIFVSKGQRVSAGCSIGLLGHSGGNADSRNPSMGKDISHLHYEIIYNGRASNVKTPSGRNIKIVRGGNRSCGNFKSKIKPDDFVTYYYK